MGADENTMRWLSRVISCENAFRSGARLLSNVAAVAVTLLAGSLRVLAQAKPVFATGPALPKLPVARSPLTLQAINDPHTGKAAFFYRGREVPPVIHASPGDVVQINYLNRMSSHSRETCVDGPCRNMTNLHFHGLHVSPDAPQDDVISMMAMPGESLHYRVDIPFDQPPGLYWYHTHPHGESYQQSLDGMSGAIVIDGMDRYVPEVRSMRERILVLRDVEIKSHDPVSVAEENRVQLSPRRCSTVSEAPERIFTVNGTLRPSIAIAPGERQFWRIVNASPDLYADLEVDSEKMTVVALDGMPLAFHDPARRSEVLPHVLLPPAGRVEAIVTGPAPGVHASLRTACIDTGKAGDPNPAMALADLNTSAQPKATVIRHVSSNKPAIYRTLPPSQLAMYERRVPDFIVKFTEDAHGFYINNRKYSPTEGPMTQVTTGGYQHWRVINATDELHPFHIHQVHFLAYATNGKAEDHSNWLDTVNVPARGSVDLIMDFTDPIIRGMSLFHCHLLKHEDKGMMAKILFK
jgi:FtsP/CotA-like multicopper oxidase with cupredoxin domain